MKSKDLIKHLQILSVVLLSMPMLINAEKLTEFQEPFENVLLAIDDGQIYIVDRGTNIIHIYSREDYTPIAQFGGKGQGPAEFDYIGFIRIYSDHLYIGSGLKFSYFSKKGKFQKTYSRLPKPGLYFPLGKNIIRKDFPKVHPKEPRGKAKFELLDRKFNKVKDVFSTESIRPSRYNFGTGKYDTLLIRGCKGFEVYKDRLYIGNTDYGFYFIVFDANGNKLYEINKEYKKQKMTDRYKKQIFREMRAALGDQNFKSRQNYFNYEFPNYFPPYSDFFITDNKIYVFSYPMIEDPQEIVILDLRGNHIKNALIPKDLDFYFIHKGKFYYLIYSDETYLWELHCERID